MTTQDRRRIPRISLASGWDGTGSLGKEAPEFQSRSHTQIAISSESIPSAGVLRLRARPAGMTRMVAIDPVIDAIDLSTANSARFTVAGFYGGWSATFSTPKSGGGGVSIDLLALGEEIAATQLTEKPESRAIPNTFLSSGWTGVGKKSTPIPSHDGLTHHHFSFASTTLPTVGILTLSGIPLGGTAAVKIGDYDLTVTGTVNTVFPGVFCALSMEIAGAYDGGDIEAVVSSTGELLSSPSIVVGSAAQVPVSSGWRTVTAGEELVSGAPVVVNNVTTQTMTLPASPTIGDVFSLNSKDAAHRIVSNGNTIDGVGAGNDLLVDADATAVLVAYGANLLRIV